MAIVIKVVNDAKIVLIYLNVWVDKLVILIKVVSANYVFIKVMYLYYEFNGKVIKQF